MRVNLFEVFMESLYTAIATSTGGRDGRSVSSDKRLEVQLSTPKELGGLGGDGTNPEQLFAAGYSACFIGALKVVAAEEKVKLPENVSIQAAIGIGANTQGVGFTISANLEIDLPGLDTEAKRLLVEKAHQVCPYSNATRNNIDVQLTII